MLTSFLFSMADLVASVRRWRRTPWRTSMWWWSSTPTPSLFAVQKSWPRSAVANHAPSSSPRSEASKPSLWFSPANKKCNHVLVILFCLFLGGRGSLVLNMLRAVQNELGMCVCGEEGGYFFFVMVYSFIVCSVERIRQKLNNLFLVLNKDQGKSLIFYCSYRLAPLWDYRTHLLERERTCVQLVVRMYALQCPVVLSKPLVFLLSTFWKYCKVTNFRLETGWYILIFVLSRVCEEYDVEIQWLQSKKKFSYDIKFRTFSKVRNVRK